MQTINNIRYHSRRETIPSFDDAMIFYMLHLTTLLAYLSSPSDCTLSDLWNTIQSVIIIDMIFFRCSLFDFDLEWMQVQTMGTNLTPLVFLIHSILCSAFTCNHHNCMTQSTALWLTPTLYLCCLWLTSILFFAFCQEKPTLN